MCPIVVARINRPFFGPRAVLFRRLTLVELMLPPASGGGPSSSAHRRKATSWLQGLLLSGGAGGACRLW